MPDFTFNVISNSSVGNTAFDITLGNVTIGTIETITVTDDDLIFDDEASNGGQTVDASSQVLAADIGVGVAGQVVQSVFVNTITNTTTGETGNAHLIRIYTGTDPSNPGSQNGEYYWAFDIEVSPGDVITQSGTNFVGQVAFSDIACFTAGTLIKTNRGELAIECLVAGDMVLTMDNGYQPIRWIGSTKVKAQGDLAPILIRKGALKNKRDLRVSPQHRMLLQGWQAELLFGQTEVLVPAKSLLNDCSITRDEGAEVEYFHMLFDTHEIVWAEGALSESFHPGEQGWNSFDQATRDEILLLFPQLAEQNFNSYSQTARVCLKNKESALLAPMVTAH
jgi:hypothetical protein